MAQAAAPAAEGPQSIHFVVGIKTSYGKFLNCEKFNFQLSSNATAIRQKQTFVLEPTEDGKWYIRSWLNKHLSAHALGEVSIKTDGRTPSEQWTLEFLNGLVALKSSHGKYLTSDENNLQCKAAAVGDKEKFELVFSIHPQIVLKSFEGRYVRAEGDDIIANKEQQFGVGTLITLEYDNNGKYAFKTVSGRYMSASGAGGTVKGDKAAKTETELFTFELVGKKLAIKTNTGKYLSPDGVKGNLKAKLDKITNRELFEMFHSDPQITIKAHNKKYVSCQERNIMCNRTTVGDDETFIMEHVKESIYALRTVQAKYWSCVNGSLVVDQTKKSASEQFVLGYTTGKTYFKSLANAEGKAYYISAKSLGGVRGVAAAGEAGDQELYEVHLLNRPQLVLRTKQLAFVGTSGDKIMANKNNSETFTVEFADGAYLVKNSAGNYFSIGADDKVVVVPEKKVSLFVEFVNGRLAFKTEEGRYLVSDDHGNFVLGDKRAVPPPDSQFEF